MAIQHVEHEGGKGKAVVFSLQIEELMALYLDPLRRFLAGIEAAGEDGAHSAEDVGAIGSSLLREAQAHFDKDMADAARTSGRLELQMYRRGPEENIGREGRVCGVVFNPLVPVPAQDVPMAEITQ